MRDKYVTLKYREMANFFYMSVNRMGFNKMWGISSLTELQS